MEAAGTEHRHCQDAAATHPRGLAILIEAVWGELDEIGTLVNSWFSRKTGPAWRLQCLARPGELGTW